MELILVNPEAKLPVKGSRGSAGLDVTSIETKTILPLSHKTFKTGLQISTIHPKIRGRVLSRSGLCVHSNIICMEDIIDCNSEDEITITLFNLSSTTPTEIKHGDRICQIVFQKYPNRFHLQIDTENLSPDTD